MDFMVELPGVNGFNALMVIVDKLGKLSLLVPCRAGESVICPGIDRMLKMKLPCLN